MENNVFYDAFFCFFYTFLVRSPATLLQGVATGIAWLSNANIINLIVHSENNHFVRAEIPYYDLFGFLGIAVFLVLGCSSLIRSISSGNSKTVLLQTCKNFSVFLFCFFAVPFLAFALNAFASDLIHGIFHTSLSGSGLANQTAKMGFYDQSTIPPGWNYNKYPPDVEKYSIFIAAVSVISVLTLFLLLGIMLVRRIFMILVCVTIVPLLVAKCSGTNQWGSFLRWKEQMVANFLTVFGVFLAFNVFSIIMPRITSAINVSQLSSSSKTSLKMLVVLGSSYSTFYLSKEIRHFAEGGVNTQSPKVVFRPLKRFAFWTHREIKRFWNE